MQIQQELQALVLEPQLQLLLLGGLIDQNHHHLIVRRDRLLNLQLVLHPQPSSFERLPIELSTG
jgi:hypothetical protein